ncbi:methyl-accepting chemotaxis protein [Alsobacter sp. SYSU M60028]|uniref:Methyl-accepting chemotaxis protein n=1 Tax=Alsobacter ponti TaxID=2962936 RepID=A0ABT1LGB1_9HYPH|nr:methyl-accepting chemotaxis protein [Alsobacter ponti]MCP8939996.1 methyl-accepting chemotaxis protein [Alsobacter ponti]
MLNVKSTFVAMVGVSIVAGLFQIGALVGYRRAAHAVSDAHDARYASYLLADEMRQSSDDLTRLARTYVVTGDPAYKQQYNDIIAIRNGQKPRPVEAHRVYWDFVAAGNPQPRPPGRTVALLDLMKEAGFSREEFGKLEEAKANSDGLIGLEVEAMNAVEGKDARGNPAPADPERARELLHSAQYHRYKAQIMKPVDDFFVLLDQRTAGAIERAESSLGLFMLLTYVTTALLAGSVIVLCGFMWKRVLKGLDGIRAAMAAIAGGDLATQVPDAHRTDEIGVMANALVQFRENAAHARALEAEERAGSDRRVAQAREMAEVVKEVGAVVEAAARGDFSRRARASASIPELGALVDSVNQINEVVDQATGEFADALGAVASGDLTRTVDSQYAGRLGELRDAINATVVRLSEAVSTIQATTQDVGNAAREINSGSDDLSKRTESQAASLEETAATTEQLAASVKSSAAASRQAVVVAEEAMGVAQTGGSIVRKAVDAMARIEAASQKITDITSVIDDIAFQTNLLALNAAVEAARAGDAGKGFAVVASEVRTLAQRSSEAAKDITGLIQSSTAQVAEGVQLVRSAGDALGQIVEASSKVSTMVNEISAAAVEQANGIEEMSQTVAHMDEMVQQNAALAEQSAASAATLTQQIERLDELVAGFRTRTGDAARGEAVRREPARLRQMAEAAFSAPAARQRPKRAAGNGGWSEF